MADQPPSYHSTDLQTKPAWNDQLGYGQPQPQSENEPDKSAGSFPPAAPYPAPPAYHGPTTTVITHQPLMVPTQVAQPGLKPSNYLAFSIINMVCCCFIFGLIALVFSLQVDSAWSSNCYEEARKHANISKILNIIGLSVGITGWVIVGLYVLAQIIYVIVLGVALNQENNGLG